MAYTPRIYYESTSLLKYHKSLFKLCETLTFYWFALLGLPTVYKYDNTIWLSSNRYMTLFGSVRLWCTHYFVVEVLGPMLFDGVLSCSPLGHWDFECFMCRPSLAHTLNGLEMTMLSKHAITLSFAVLEANCICLVASLGVALSEGCQLPPHPSWPTCSSRICISSWLYEQSAASWSSVMHVSHQPVLRTQPVKQRAYKLGSIFDQSVWPVATASLR